jgi:FtsH-binding integral membrane protein
MANELGEKGSKKGKKVRFQRTKRVVRKFTNFFGRRHIWSGLLAGFLWAFSVPFVITAFLPFFNNLSEEVKWILFFPLESSLTLMAWVLGPSSVDAVLLWILSVFVGMFLGVVFTYSIHRIRVWRRLHNISRAVPSE